MFAGPPVPVDLDAGSKIQGGLNEKAIAGVGDVARHGGRGVRGGEHQYRDQ